MTRFLHLFSAHRDALERAQRAEDLLLHERDRADRAEALLTEAYQDALKHERELLAKALAPAPRTEPHIATPEDHALQLAQIGEPVKKWQKMQTATTMGKLEKMRQDILAKAKQMERAS
jgi:hypothetical protein